MDAALLTEENSPSMRAQFRLPLVIVLAGMLFASIVVVSPHLIVHEVDHGNHRSNSHSSPLCAWFCAVGQAMNTSLPLTAAQHAEEEALDSSHPSPRRNVPPTHLFTRGPPSEG